MDHREKIAIVIVILMIIFLVSINVVSAKPLVIDSNLRVQYLVKVPFKPSNMAFIDRDYFLILDRDGGRVYGVRNFQFEPMPLIDVNVATVGYRGMLGIDILAGKDNVTYAFLYYTESGRKDGDDETNQASSEPLGNRLYRYQLEDGKLIKPRLLLDLPTKPGPRHTGGEVAVGPDDNIYLTVGDMDGTFKKNYETMAQNYLNVTTVDGRGGILRVTPDGKPVGSGILGNQLPLNLYFGYGVRNSFGLDWDPITGHLWDTENGPHFGDEINLVLPGFNSGWVKVHGVWAPDFEEMGRTLLEEPNDLVDFHGKGKYSKPEFTWALPIAPTALKFFSSAAYGPAYENDLFVADANTGRIYHFELNENRSELQLEGDLADRIAHDMKEMKETTFAEGFGRITDMQVGPDGNLYILSTNNKGASIDRIISTQATS